MAAKTVNVATMELIPKSTVFSHRNVHNCATTYTDGNHQFYHVLIGR